MRSRGLTNIRQDKKENLQTEIFSPSALIYLGVYDKLTFPQGIACCKILNLYELRVRKQQER